MKIYLPHKKIICLCCLSLLSITITTRLTITLILKPQQKHQYTLHQYQLLTQKIQYQKKLLNQCQMRQQQLTHYPISTQTALAAQQHPNSHLPAIEQYCTHNHLTLQQYTPNDNHSLLYFCGSFKNIQNTINHWNNPKFLSWINELSLSPCHSNPKQLQLTLSLENTL